MLYPPVSVRPSVRPSKLLPIDKLSIYLRISFFNFAYKFVSGVGGLGLLVGEILQFLTNLQPVLVSVKCAWPVIPLLHGS